MSLKWPSKDPDEVLDYSVDWSRFLAAQETIGSVDWFIDVDGVKTAWASGAMQDGIQHISSTNTDSVATIYLGSGTPNKTYKITCRIQTSASIITERVVRIKIRDHY
jgi:hypothetical protein